MNNTQPAQLAENLGIAAIPASWSNHWNSFIEWNQTGECPGWAVSMPPDAAQVFDLPAGAIEPLREVLTAIAADAELAELARFWHYLIFHLPESTGDHPNGWPLPEARLGGSVGLFPLAVLVSGTEHAWSAFKRKGVNDEIAYATLAFGGLYVRDYRERHGKWGLSELGWLRNHVRADIFRLGKLVFNAAVFKWPFRAYRSRRTGEVITLCDASGKYRTDGLADGTNAVYDPQAWSPELELNDLIVCGHPLNTEGTALQSRITLHLEEWELVLSPGDSVIDVHIPSGGKLLAEQCAESYANAKQFFADYYPERKFAAFACRSWLMDPGLTKILPPHSNIVQFQRAFRILPLIGNHLQTYDLVFGDSRIEPAAAPRTTLLQRAIAAYVSAGNKVRSVGGYFLIEEHA